MGNLLNPFRLAPVGGNIQFVGMQSQIGTPGAKTVSLTTLTGGLASTAIQDDFVLAIGLAASAANRTLGISTSGFTTIANAYANDQHDTMMYIGWKFMTSTPDTSVSYSSGSDSGGGHICVNYVFRGVNLTTPLDVSAVNNSPINGSVPDPGSITPVTSGARIVLIHAAAHIRGAVDFTGTGHMSNLYAANKDGTTKDLTVAIGNLAWAGGTYDPPALSITGSDPDDSNATSVIALRPA